MVVVEFAREVETELIVTGADCAEPFGRGVEDEVNAALQASPYRPIRRVVCSVRQGVLLLTGTVPSYYMKQQAQALVKSLGVERLVVDNQVVVERSRSFTFVGCHAP
jgi:osmotically-inducible protein OsmY